MVFTPPWQCANWDILRCHCGPAPLLMPLLGCCVPAHIPTVVFAWLGHAGSCATSACINEKWVCPVRGAGGSCEWVHSGVREVKCVYGEGF